MLYLPFKIKQSISLHNIYNATIRACNRVYCTISVEFVPLINFVYLFVFLNFMFYDTCKWRLTAVGFH